MNKKLLTISILFLLAVSFMIIPNSIASESSVFEPTGFRIFKFNTTIDLQIDTEPIKDPLLPGTSVELDVTAKYEFSTPPLFPNFLLNTKIGNWIIFRDPDHNMSVDIGLSAEVAEDWVTATFTDETLTFDNFSTDPVELQTKLNITVSSNAEALESAKVSYSPTFNYENNWGLVGEGDETQSFEVVTGYVCEVKPEIENTTIEIPPEKKTLIPVEITVESNGETNVSIEFTGDIPKGWNLTLDKELVKLNSDKNVSILLNVTAPADFTNETINIKFKPALSKDSEYTGKETELSILFENDGSAEEEGLEIDSTILVIILVIIILIVIIAVFLLRKKH
jgi:hypothetical protein